jgi:hypothetical protein
MVLTDFAQYLKNNVHTYIEIYRDVRFKFYVFALESVDFAASSQCEPLVICNKDAAHLKAAISYIKILILPDFHLFIDQIM